MQSHYAVNNKKYTVQIWNTTQDYMAHAEEREDPGEQKLKYTTSSD